MILTDPSATNTFKNKFKDKKCLFSFLLMFEMNHQIIFRVIVTHQKQITNTNKKTQEVIPCGLFCLKHILLILTTSHLNCTTLMTNLGI